MPSWTPEAGRLEGRVATVFDVIIDNQTILGFEVDTADQGRVSVLGVRIGWADDPEPARTRFPNQQVPFVVERWPAITQAASTVTTGRIVIVEVDDNDQPVVLIRENGDR